MFAYRGEDFSRPEKAASSCIRQQHNRVWVPALTPGSICTVLLDAVVAQNRTMALASSLTPGHPVVVQINTSVASWAQPHELQLQTGFSRYTGLERFPGIEPIAQRRRLPNFSRRMTLPHLFRRTAMRRGGGPIDHVEVAVRNAIILFIIPQVPKRVLP